MASGNKTPVKNLGRTRTRKQSAYACQAENLRQDLVRNGCNFSIALLSEHSLMRS